MVAMRYVLLHPASCDISPIAAALEADRVECHVIHQAADLKLGSEATVLLLDADARDMLRLSVLSHFVQSGGAIVALGAPGEVDVPEDLSDAILDAWLPHRPGSRALLLALRGAYRSAAARREALEARQEAAIRTREITELTQIGAALATERDYHKLLTLILSQARRVTHADAGSLYLVEEHEDGSRHLHFKLAQNHSRSDLSFSEFTMPIDRSSIAGYVADCGAPVSIEDAYALTDDAPYSINRSFDEKHGYRTRSVLAIPMQNHRDKVIGVLQLINCKDHFDTVLESPEDFATRVRPFDHRAISLVQPFAGQAAISLENSQLYESIERLFEGFVTAAVTAIEQRDPTTSGHSLRVATMTVDLAQTVDHLVDGPYADIRFSRDQIKELRYAGLLHDFGKVGVREEVLVKAKKLYPQELDMIRWRHAFIRQHATATMNQQRVDYLESQGRQGYDEFMARLEREQQSHIDTLDRLMDLIHEANEPTVVQQGTFDELLRLAPEPYIDLDGGQRPLLNANELRCLTIRKGSLDDAERREIESHVEHTYRFLRQIPWTSDLRGIPAIAYGHHEKLNGGGYPRSIGGDEIPVQTRMMTIADIFDALTAADRPYKRAVSTERALDIMQREVDGQMLDSDLFRIFIEAKVYQNPLG